jgi:hypothetical protein
MLLLTNKLKTLKGFLPMGTNLQKYKADLEVLIARSTLLRYAFADDLGLLDPKSKRQLREEQIQLPVFKDEYEKWYSEALEVIRQALPSRYDDFKHLYKDEKRKTIDYLTYAMSDYMIGLRTTRGLETVVDTKAAFPKFEQQVKILKAAEKRFDSSLFEIKQLLQADIFDSEIDTARELLRNGYIRAAGAVVGVVLEKHLQQVSYSHRLTIKGKTPSISDYDQALKDAQVIEVPTWRFIQHLADLRNLCDHKKEREPKPEEIESLINGVEKVTKTLF